MYKSLTGWGTRPGEAGDACPQACSTETLGVVPRAAWTITALFPHPPSLRSLSSGSCQLAQDPAELLSAMAQLLDPVHHVLGGGGRWVLQGSSFGGGHDATQEVAQ